MGVFSFFKHKKEFDELDREESSNFSETKDNHFGENNDDTPTENTDLGFRPRFENVEKPNFSTNNIIGDKDLQLIYTKLEVINQKLENIDRRIQEIERIAKE